MVLLIALTYTVSLLLNTDAACTGADLLVLCPYDSEVRIGKTAASAALVALDTIKERRILPEDFKLQIKFEDSMCGSVPTLEAILKWWDTENFSVDAVVGPVCSGACSSAADFLQIRNLPVISWDCTQPDLSEKKNFLRTVSDYGKFHTVISAFMKHYNLEKLVMVCSVETIWITTCESIKTSLNSNITVMEIIPLLITNSNDDSVLKEVLETKVKPSARVVFLACYINDIKKIMTAASGLDMLNGYLYFGMEVTPSMLTDSDDQKQQYLQGLISFNFGIASSNEEFKSFREKVYKLRDKVKIDDVTVMDELKSAADIDSLAVNLHDAVILYALGLNKSIAAGDDECSVKKANITNLEFEGIINRIKIDKFGNVLSPDTLVLNFQNSSDGAFKLEEVGQVFNNEYKKVDGVSIIWPGNRRKPINNCGDNDELCPKDDKDIVMMISFVVVTIVIIIVVAIALVLWMRKKHNQLKTAWKIPYDELSFHSVCNYHQGSAAGSKFALGSRVESITSHPTQPTEEMQAAFGYRKANFKRQPVAVLFLERQSMTISKTIVRELNALRDMEHENIVKFYGMCVDVGKVCLVYSLCPKGTLQDVLQNEKLNLDVMFQQSFITDLVKGLEYIHKSSIGYHGNLESQNILIDGHWVLKLTKFGLRTIREKEKILHLQNKDDPIEKNKSERELLWKAPELLDELHKGSQKGDIYSFAIICTEILTREDPYAMYNLQPLEIISRVRKRLNPPFRPDVRNTILGSFDLREMITQCWKDQADQRPDIARVKVMTRELTSRQKSLTDRMMMMMEKYTHHLEDLVDEKTAQLQVEKNKADKLLYRMLPMKVAEKLKRGESVVAEWFDEVTIYFSDIVGFTTICSDSTPLEVVDFLNDLYTCFDAVIENYDVYKVETIGDAYMVVSGLPNKNGKKHSSEIADMALMLLEKIKTFKIRHRPNKKCQLRIGLHTGPCCAGVVGLAMPRYCLFGDTVNMASRMESNGLPLRIHISPSTYEALQERGTHVLEERGLMEIKGKGEIFTYWVNGRREVRVEDVKTSIPKQPFQKFLPQLSNEVSSHPYDSELLPLLNGDTSNNSTKDVSAV